MADGLMITFEMELDRIEGLAPTARLRLMWSYAMEMIEHLLESNERTDDLTVSNGSQ